MKARTANYPSGPVVAFGGVEYVKYEWRDVPPDSEIAAELHPFLEVEKPKPTPKKTVTKKPATRRRRKATPKENK